MPTLSFDDLANPLGAPLALVPGSSQVPGFSFTGATVYHRAHTTAPGYPYSAPTDPSHPAFIQSRNADGSRNQTISIALAGDQAGGDIESISFKLANDQTGMVLWAFDDQGGSTYFDFVAGGFAWSWNSQSLSLTGMGVINRIEFQSVVEDGVVPAFALTDLNFTLVGLPPPQPPEFWPGRCDAWPAGLAR